MNKGIMIKYPELEKFINGDMEEPPQDLVYFKDMFQVDFAGYPMEGIWIDQVDDSYNMTDGAIVILDNGSKWFAMTEEQITIIEGDY